MNPNIAPATGPFYPGQLNTNFTPLYHLRNFSASALGTEVTFFGEAMGVNGVGAEITNMTRPFELESPRRMTVTHLAVQTYDTDDADLYKLYKGYTCQLIVGGIVQISAPIDFWPAGGGLYNGGFGNGLPGVSYRQTIMPHPVEIPSSVGFSVRLLGSSQTIAAAASIRVYLIGPFARPIG